MAEVAAPEQLAEVAAPAEVAEEPSGGEAPRAARAVGFEKLSGEAFAAATWATVAEAASVRRVADEDCTRQFELAHTAARFASEIESMWRAAVDMAEARGDEHARSRRRPWAQDWPGHHGRRLGVARGRAAKAERPPTAAERAAAAPYSI